MASANPVYLHYIMRTYLYKNVRTMDAKLTLSIRPDVIEKAKAWALQTGTSISAAVEEFLEKKVEAAAQKETSLDVIRRLSKGVRQYSDEELEEQKRAYLEKKHGPF